MKTQAKIATAQLIENQLIDGRTRAAAASIKPAAQAPTPFAAARGRARRDPRGGRARAKCLPPSLRPGHIPGQIEVRK